MVMMKNIIGHGQLPVSDVDEELLRLYGGDEVREAGGLDLSHLVEGDAGLERGSF